MSMEEQGKEPENKEGIGCLVAIHTITLTLLGILIVITGCAWSDSWGDHAPGLWPWTYHKHFFEIMWGIITHCIDFFKHF